MASIAQLLGDKADYLLGFNTPKISKDRLHLPGPDFVDRVFAPSEEEVAWARTVVAAFALPENAGRGAVRVEGKMAELLHRDQAARTLAVHETILPG